MSGRWHNRCAVLSLLSLFGFIIAAVTGYAVAGLFLFLLAWLFSEGIGK